MKNLDANYSLFILNFLIFIRILNSFLIIIAIIIFIKELLNISIQALSSLEYNIADNINFKRINSNCKR